MTHRSMILGMASVVASLSGATAGSDSPGISDTEIKLGQTMPYSGPASAYGTIGRMEQAYFDMVDSKGGVKGRKIMLISLDDAYSPPKTSSRPGN
jgi:branched-chain amino acid transport system substrate-binding protein